MPEDKNSNLIVLPGGNTPALSKEALRELRVNLPQILEYFSITAQMHRAKYAALLNEGFTGKEALELCKILF